PARGGARGSRLGAPRRPRAGALAVGAARRAARRRGMDLRADRVLGSARGRPGGASRATAPERMTDGASLTTATVERVLPAPPAQAYDAWLDEEVLRDFMCPAPGVASEVSVDPRVGGSFRFVMSFPDRVSEITGEYIAL